MFTRSVKIFELLGFKVWVDASWLLLAVLITWSLAVGVFPHGLPDQAVGVYWMMGLGGLIGLAFSIIAHELAHAVVARRYDMPIRGITLFVFGGVAQMESEPTSARGELLMAIAGPVMSLAVAVAFYAIALVLARAGIIEPLSPLAVVLGWLALINGVLAVFNMIPAFPLDGGRVLRAVLWGWRGDILWATRVAANAGFGFAFALIALGLVSVLVGNFLGGIWWFLLGLFVHAAARGTLQHQTMRSALSGWTVDRLMRRDPVAVPPDLTIERFVDDYVYRHYFKQFPVTANDRLIGCIAIDGIKEMDRSSWPRQTVRAAMQPCSEENTVAPDADAARALEQMQRTGRSRLLVVDRDRLVGVLALRDLLSFLSVRMDLEPVQSGDTGSRR